MPPLRLLFSLVAATLPAQAVTYFWNSGAGGGDGVSLYQEANWTTNANGSGSQIPVINPGAPITAASDLIVNGGIPGGGGGGSGTLDLNGGSLTVNGGTFRMNTGNGAGISNGPITQSGGTIITQFVTNSAITLSAGTLELNGADNPLSSATLNFTSGATGVVRFNSESVAAVTTEHLSKITVNGSPAVAGSNVSLVSNGGSGSTLTLFNPNADSDSDGLSDADEINLHGTNPAARDTDGDGTPDGLEIEKGLDPNNPAEFLDRPNIIFFFVDDLGYGDIGCFWQDTKSGTQKFDTPGIDTMASEGAKLTHHYISASVCAPSRASLLQGRHQGHSEVRNSQFDEALLNNHTVSGLLQRAGYHTIHVGKNGLAGGEDSTVLTGTGSQNLAAHPLDRGFDDFFGYLFHGDGHEHYPRNGTTDKSAYIYDGYQQITTADNELYTTDAWTAYAKNAITAEAQDGDTQPFFLYLAYDTPHFKMQYPPTQYPAGGGLTGGIQWTGAPTYASTAADPGAAINNAAVGEHPSTVSTGWPTSNKQHVAMIRRIDDSVADIIQLLKDLNIDDNTLCIFTSDNGPHNEGNNPRFFESFANMEGIKRDMWEAGIRVPTVVRWPGNIAGATNNENNIHEIDYPSAIWDWMPTFAEMAEIPAPAWCDGVSLLPTLTGSGTQRDKGYLYFEFQSGGSTSNWTEFLNHGGDTKGEMQCVRIGDHMGVRTGISSASDNFKIYDVTIDPAQGMNLAGSLPALQEQMKDIALQGRRPGGGVSRPYDSANLPAVGAAVQQGLEAASYEGIWTYVPEFRDLTPAATVNVANIDLSVRTRDDDVGLLFTGFLQAPTTGSYTFSLTSDSGSNLFIHDAHVIDDDFGHDGAESSGTINLEAGLHPLRIYYRHGTLESRSLNFSYSGPGIPKQTVPDSALFRAGTPPPEPLALEDTATSTGAFVDIDVLANDSDDGAPAPLSVSSIGNPANGSAVELSGEIRYTPNPGFYGIDLFSYTITDGQFFASALVTVNVAYVDPNELWLPFNDHVGLSTKSVSSAVNGTLVGFADSTSHWVDGLQSPNGLGKAIQFNGTSTSVQLDGSYSPPTGSSSRSITAWIKATGTGAIVAWGPKVGGQKWHWRLEDAGTGTGALRIEVEGGYRRASSDLRDNQWHHVALVFAGSTVSDCRMYVDGVEDTPYTTGTNQTINTGNTVVEIGKDSQSRYFQGLIDEVHIYRSVLSLGQLQAEMAATNQEAQAWHRQNFGPAVINWAADDDGDQVDRLGEFAFGGNPHLADAGVTMPEVFYNPATLKLETTFRRLFPGSHNLLYTLEVSNDLQDWTALTATEIGSTVLSLADCLEEATFETDATSATEPRQFTRAKVELLP